MSRFDATYNIRTPIRTCGSSKGIFLDTCIIPSMMTRLVLEVALVSIAHLETQGKSTYI